MVKIIERGVCDYAKSGECVLHLDHVEIPLGKPKKDKDGKKLFVIQSEPLETMEGFVDAFGIKIASAEADLELEHFFQIMRRYQGEVGSVAIIVGHSQASSDDGELVACLATPEELPRNLSALVF